MNELASLTIGAIELNMILLAETGLILAWDVLFLLQLEVAMSERATISKPALSSELPISAHLNIIMKIPIYLPQSCT